MKHTKGPWEYDTFPNDHISVRQVGSTNTAVAAVLGHRPFEEKLANARLIAAAPELLEALKNILEIFTKGRGGEIQQHEIVDACLIARNAIAKTNNNVFSDE
jgi:hypothetical protein